MHDDPFPVKGGGDLPQGTVSMKLNAVGSIVNVFGIKRPERMLNVNVGIKRKSRSQYVASGSYVRVN